MGFGAAARCDRSAYPSSFNQHIAALALSREASLGASNRSDQIFSVLVAHLLPNAEKAFL